MRDEMSRVNHPIEQEELMAYLDGELSTERAAAAVAHLEQCAQCQRLAADLREVSQELRSWEVGSSSPAITRGVVTALDERERKQQGSVSSNLLRWREMLRMRPIYPWVGALAAVSLVLAVGFSLIGRNANVAFFSRQHPQSVTIQRGIAEPAGAAGGSIGKLMGGLQTEGSAGKNRDSLDGSLPIATGPMIVRTAKLTLTTREFEKARASLEDVLKRHRGYFGELNVSAPVGAARTLNATLRVPGNQLEATLAELKQLGRVESEWQGGQDVTSQYVDLEARLSNARHTEQRLTDVLQQRTGKLADVLAVENEISRVRGQIEQMEAERKNLANQVDFATVSATVNEDYKAQLQVVPSSTSTRFRNAAVEGYRTVVEGAVGVAVFLVSYGPILLFWGGLLFLPVRSVWRRFRRAMAQ
jgi:Domain of unknown function (DUF4349)/Putative zinc-finger